MENGVRRVSGKKVLAIMALGIAVLWLSLFFYSMERKREAQERRREFEKAMADSAQAREKEYWIQLADYLAHNDSDWVELTELEGQGFVLFKPCSGSTGHLRFKPAHDGVLGYLSGVLGTDSGKTELRARTGSHHPEKANIGIHLEGGSRLWLEWVDAEWHQRFPSASLQEALVIFESQTGDSSFFVPEEEARLYEVFREEDRAPSGCFEADSFGEPQRD